VLTRPKLVLLGAALQYTVMPLLGLAVSRGAGLATPLAIGWAARLLSAFHPNFFQGTRGSRGSTGVAAHFFPFFSFLLSSVVEAWRPQSRMEAGSVDYKFYLKYK